MNFNIDTVIDDMLNAIKEVAESDIKDIEGYLKQILEGEKDTLKELAVLRLSGQITDDEFNSEIESEKDTFKAQMEAITVMTLSTKQKAINAAIGVFTKAVMSLV